MKGMEKRDSTPSRHAHACGHDCECAQPTFPGCDRCAIADLVRFRHGLGDMPDGEVLARLYLALQIVASEGVVMPQSGVIDDLIELERGHAPWSR